MIKRKKIYIYIGSVLLCIMIIAGFIGIKNKYTKYQKDRVHKFVMINCFWLSIKCYAGNYDNYCPNDLGILYDEEFMQDGRQYVAYDSRLPVPKNGEEIRTGKCAFIYFGKGKKLTKVDGSPGELSTEKLIPILATKPGIYDDENILVLYSNGTVQTVSLKKWQNISRLSINNIDLEAVLFDK